MRNLLRFRAWCGCECVCRPQILLAADEDGVIVFTDKYNMVAKINIDITELLVVDSVTLATGDLYFDGNVYVKGNAGSGAGV